MHEQVEALRTRVDEVTRGADGRRVFTAAIRKDAVELATQWKAKGRHLSALADALGVHKTTLTSWLGGTKPKKRRVRSVRVATEAGSREATRPKSGSLIAVLPSGIRIEGLGIGEAIELASALR